MALAEPGHKLPIGWLELSQRASLNNFGALQFCSALCVSIHLKRLSECKPSIFHQ
jgi:hypothetical protein